MRMCSWCAALTCVCMSVVLSGPAWSASINLNLSSGTRITVPLQSFKDLRDQHVVKQAYDYSCGAAALATLLTYGLGDQVTEEDVLLFVLTSLSMDEKTVRKSQGLSLLDLQRFVQTRGHKAQGFKLAPQYLPQLKGPVIAFIKPRGYEHFAVLRGIRWDRVYLADPSLGNVRMAIGKFLDMWLDAQGQGIIFVVEAQESPWTAEYPLKLPSQGLPQPELLTTRQMLEIGNPYVLFQQLFR